MNFSIYFVCMTKQLTAFIFILIAIQSYSQDKRELLLGIVTNDSTSVEGIHIYNKNTNRGTITNNDGLFSIYVKENDTLLVSGIQFYYREIKITNEILHAEKIKIDLFQKINELEEVELKSHNLIGNITVDAENAPIPESKVAEGILDFSTIDFSQPVISNIDEIDRRKPPDAERLTSPMAPVGGNILGLLSFALDPLIGEVSKIGQNRRERKRQEYLFEKKSKEVPDEIVAYLGESFFIETLNIPYEKINDFIEYCKPKGLHRFYVENKKIEAIDLLIKEAKEFNKTD